MPDNSASKDTERTQVLTIGMLDSIHFARWLTQFKDENIDFRIFPSKKFKKLHPQLKSLLTSRFIATYNLQPKAPLLECAGYFDFIRNVFPVKIGIDGTRKSGLTRLITKNSFDFIHALEIQGAGYLVNSLSGDLRAKSKFILTNWGSDIYYFKNFPYHREILEELLPKADYYSAECLRDYKLAKEMGFSGKELPCIPNAGGFKLEILEQSFSNPSNRNQIILKGYGGIFGKAELAINTLHKISEKFPKIEFYIYSVTDDIEKIMQSLPVELRNRLRYSTQRNSISHESLLHEFGKSRVYIGSSLSDGISTSFLESLITGAYPVQTNTSCAAEWIAMGAHGSIVALASNEIYEAVAEALSNDQLVDSAADLNKSFAVKFLDEKKVKTQALRFYEKTFK